MGDNGKDNERPPLSLQSEDPGVIRLVTVVLSYFLVERVLLSFKIYCQIPSMVSMDAEQFVPTAVTTY